MNDLVLEKTKELGEVISGCKEHLELMKWSDLLENDPEAKALVMNYNANRDAKMREIQENGMDEDAVREAREYVQEEFSKILENNTIYHYIEASNRFEELMNQVNNLIQFCINGEENSGCGGNCGCCSGCH